MMLFLKSLPICYGYLVAEAYDIMLTNGSSRGISGKIMNCYLKKNNIYPKQFKEYF